MVHMHIAYPSKIVFAHSLVGQEICTHYIVVIQFVVGVVITTIVSVLFIVDNLSRLFSTSNTIKPIHSNMCIVSVNGRDISVYISTFRIICLYTYTRAFCSRDVE